MNESHWPAVGAESPRRVAMGQLLDAAVARHRDAVALVEGVADADQRRRWTYGELQGRSQQIARALLEQFEPGDRVALWAPNSTDWVMFQIGAGLAGLVLGDCQSGIPDTQSWLTSFANPRHVACTSPRSIAAVICSPSPRRRSRASRPWR